MQTSRVPLADQLTKSNHQVTKTKRRVRSGYTGGLSSDSPLPPPLSLSLGADRVYRYCFDEDDSRGGKFRHYASDFYGIEIRRAETAIWLVTFESELLLAKNSLGRDGSRIARGLELVCMGIESGKERRMVSCDCWYGFAMREF